VIARLAVFTPQIGTASETFIRRHVEELAPGHTVVVARNSGTGGFWSASGSVFYLDRWASDLNVRLARRMGASIGRMRDRAVSWFLRRHNVNIVLIEYLDQFVDFVPLLDRLGLPYVVQGHGIDLSAALRRPGMADRYRLYKSARAVLTRCDFHRRRLIALGLPAAQIHVNPGGVDVPVTPPVRPPEASKRFLAVGRMVPKKGPMYLLEAFRLATLEDAGISLDVIGDGPFLPAVRQFVEASGFKARVHLHGAAPDQMKQRLFSECGVFVQHSITDPDNGDEEGLPAAIQEAMAQAMAVISTRHAGIPEAIDDGVSGLLTGEGDAQGMAAAMRRVASSGQLALQLGAAARATAGEVYSWPSERSRLLGHLSVK